MIVEDGISLIDVSLSFGAVGVFSGFSASFPKGSRTCVTGPSGCGKTSLLRMVLAGVMRLRLAGLLILLIRVQQRVMKSSQNL